MPSGCACTSTTTGTYVLAQAQAETFALTWLLQYRALSGSFAFTLER